MSPFLTDRTTIETDWECGMKRWWYKHEGGTGIVPTTEAVYFKQGRDIHEDLAAVASGQTLQEVVEGIQVCEQDQLQREVDLRRLGWVVGFYLYVWPWITTHYEVVQVEEELILDRDPLYIAFTPDLILRSKANGKLVVVDYKSTGTTSPGWAIAWPWATQMHLNIAGVEEELNEPVSHASVLGLYKGYWGRGQTSHPYIYALERAGKWGTSAYKGWERHWSTEYPGGIVEWVRYLGEEGASKVFKWSSPIYKNTRLVDKLVQARKFREEEVTGAVEACQTDTFLRDMIFESRFSKCKPTFGSECPYLAACWNGSVGADPLSSGLFKTREPHHETEIIGVGLDRPRKETS